MRRDLREQFAVHPLVGAGTRYAQVGLTSDEAADFVISVGLEQKA
jgi:hypothetical protein